MSERPEEEARRKLRERELFKTSEQIEKLANQEPDGKKPSKKRFRFSPLDMSVMNRQLYTLLNAGMPMNESLNTVAMQSESLPLRQVLQDARKSMLGGVISLVEAFEKGPGVFPEWYLDLLRAGEKEDKLIAALDEAEKRFESEIPAYERNVRLRKALFGALVTLVPIFIARRFGIRIALVAVLVVIAIRIVLSFFDGTSASETTDRKQ